MFSIEQFQESYSTRVSKEYRRAQGQFFTPRWIARGLARWVMQAQPTAIVDPAFGFGILLNECVRQGYTGRLIGTEIDGDLVRFWQTEAQDANRIELVEDDFLRKDPGPLQGVIANPPYNRFQNRDIPDYIRQKMQEVLGEPPSGYTNQYALFLYTVLSRLQEGGRAAFIVPSEFLGTGYGVQVKKFLIKTNRLRHLVLFDTADRIFPDAATTACVLLFGETRQDTLRVWHLLGQNDYQDFHAICDDLGPDHARNVCIPYPELDVQINWQGIGLGEANWEGFVELRAFGRIKRGIATGANEFFLLTAPAARRIGLPGQALVPCIANADSVNGVLFTDNHWNELWRGGRDAYLFNGVNACNNAVANYIEHGERAQYHLRYLTKMRRPWYRLENREAAPLLLAVFGRSGFRAVLNRSHAVNLTAFHGFFPDKYGVPVTPLLWLYLQTPLAHLAFARQQRAYGDGLKKLEPGDWSKLLVPNWSSWPADARVKAGIFAEQGIGALERNDEIIWLEIVNEFQSLIGEQRNAMEEAIGRSNLGAQLTLM